MQSVRALRARPLSSVVVMLGLGLGIGANTAMLSVLNSVVFDPLPFPAADDLVRVWGLSPEGRPQHALGPEPLRASLGPALKTTATDPVESLWRK
jgi:hypothetical protein